LSSLFRIPIFVLFVLLSLSCQAQEVDEEIYSLNIDLSELVDKTHSERTKILTPFYEWGILTLDSVTVFSKIKAIQTLAETHKDYQLLLECELMKVHYFLYHPELPKKHTLAIMMALNERAIRENVFWLKVRTESLLGNFYFHELFQYQKGIEHLERTAYLLNGVSSKEFPLKMECFFQLGNAYFYFHDYKNAIKNFKGGLTTYYKRENDFYFIHSLNNIGVSYRELNNLDSAEIYFTKLHEFTVEEHNEVWRGLCLGNLGFNSYLRRDVESGIQMMRDAIEIAKAENYPNIVAKELMRLSEIMFDLGRTSEGINCALEAKEELRPTQAYSERARIYPLLAKVESLRGNPIEANLYLDSAFKSKDSLTKMFSSVKLMYAKQIVEDEKSKVLSERFKNKIDKEKQAVQKQRWLRNTGIIVLGLLLFVVLLFFLRYREKQKVKERRSHTERKTALKELELFRSSITDKNSMIETIQKELHVTLEKLELKEGENLDGLDESELIEQLRKSTLLTDEGWRGFSDTFEKVYPQFFKKLELKHSNLTPSETRFLALSLLRMQNKEMALMLGVGDSAIRQVKSRLRKKLDLKTDESFESFVELI